MKPYMALKWATLILACIVMLTILIPVVCIVIMRIGLICAKAGLMP